MSFSLVVSRQRGGNSSKPLTPEHVKVDLTANDTTWKQGMTPPVVSPHYPIQLIVDVVLLQPYNSISDSGNAIKSHDKGRLPA